MENDPSVKLYDSDNMPDHMHEELIRFTQKLISLVEVYAEGEERMILSTLPLVMIDHIFRYYPEERWKNVVEAVITTLRVNYERNAEIAKWFKNERCCEEDEGE